MRPLFRKAVAFCLPLLISLASPLAAQPPDEYQTLQLFFENDIFGGTDKYYSNAIQLTWLSKDLGMYREDLRLPRWILPLIDKLPFADKANSLHNVGLLFGHQIYTPENIAVHHFQEKDRPYAGFLYAGLALHSKTARRLDTMELVLGMVGPSALGEEVQNGVHDLFNGDKANGWNHQLRDEPAIRFSWQRQWRIWQWRETDFPQADLLTNAGVTVGNVRTSANLGGEMRLGYNIPADFGSDVIRPGAGVSAPVAPGQGRPPASWGMHFFAAIQMEGVAHDIFLDGNTWKDSHSVDKKPLVGSVSAGIALSIKTFKLTYRHLFHSKAFDHQEEGQVIGSVTLSYAF